MIPKIIHYCWFGEKPLPPLLQQCQSSWLEHLQGYQVMLWNEKNTTMDTPWLKLAMEEKKYAFISDYVRFKVLNEFGGIYLDTDMFILKPLEPMLEHKVFFGFQDDKNTNMAILGAEKKHPLIQGMMRLYETPTESLEVITSKVAPLLEKELKGLNPNQISSRSGIFVYPKSYFYPIPYSLDVSLSDLETWVLPNSFAAHLWYKSWYDEFSYFSVQQYRKGFKILWEKLRKEPIPPWSYFKFLFYSLLVNFQKSLNQVFHKNELHN